MKYAITLQRVSSEDQSDNTSIDSQNNFNEQILREKGYKVIKSFSEVKSGRGQRSTVEDAFQYVEKWNRRKSKKEQISLVAVYDWSRWFRNVDLAGYWKTKFQEIGAEVNATSEWVDSEQAGQTIIRSVRMAMAEEESRDNSRRTLRGIYFTYKQGYLASTPPRGIKRVNGPDGKKWVGYDPVKGEPYRKAFMRVAAGESPSSVYSDLGGSKSFGGRSTFYEALRNPLYAGRVHYKSKIKGQPDLDVSLKTIETVTDMATFRRVQQRLSENKSTPKRIESDSLFVGKGVIRCPECGELTTSESSRNKMKKTYHYYRCVRAASHYRVRREKVDEFFEILLRELTIRPEAMEYLQDKAEAHVKEMRKACSHKIGLLKRDLEAAEKRVKKGLQLLLDEVIDKEDYERIKEEVSEVEAKISQQEFFRSNQGQLLSWFRDIFSDLTSVYESISSSGRSELLRMIFPEGFFLEHESPSADINYLRTPRLNTIFSAIPRESINYTSIKIENGLKSETIPDGGGRPDLNRRPLEPQSSALTN